MFASTSEYYIIRRSKDPKVILFVAEHVRVLLVDFLEFERYLLYIQTSRVRTVDYPYKVLKDLSTVVT